MMLVFLPESPLWLLKMGEISKAQVIIRKMATMNGVDADQEIDDLSQVNQNVHSIAASGELPDVNEVTRETLEGGTD